MSTLLLKSPQALDSPFFPLVEAQPRTKAGDLSVWNNLLLVRHGESTCNEANRFAGSADAPLTELGKAQAQRAADTWPGSPPDQILVSPLARARDTAEILFPTNSENAIPHQVDSRIVERHFGEFTLRNKAELQRAFGIRGYDEALYDSTNTIENAEPFEQFESRVSDFLENTVLPELKTGQRVLVVAHKYVVELMVRLILELPLENGYDLRLPNSRVLTGGEAARCCRRESRVFNRMREWSVLHHGLLLAVSVLAGLAWSWFGQPLAVHWTVGAGLLAAATLISLTRVDLSAVSLGGLGSWLQALTRYLVLPGMVCWFGSVVGPSPIWICVAMILAAPAGVTCLTMSRCAGGMVLPAVNAVFRSSLIGCAAVFAIHHFLMNGEGWQLGPLLLGVASITIVIPAAIARWLRRRAPIAVASFGERQACVSVFLLCGFVFFSCAQLNLSTFLPFGAIAVATSLVIRVAAWVLSRRQVLRAADDYLAMAYPNLFVVIILGQLSGFTELTQMAAWFLVPMFLLSPLDLKLSGKLINKCGDESLKTYLGIKSLAVRKIRPAVHF